jgi:DNA-directed RNA polymerase specialized sigma24 family protein
MAHHNKYPGVDPWITRTVANEVEKLVGRIGITTADIADIEQDLHLAVWSALKELRNVAVEAAVNRIVDSKIKDHIRFRQRECRDWRRVAYSLDAGMPDGEDQDEGVSEVMDLGRALDSCFGRPAPWHERREIVMDLEEALLALPGELRDLAEALDGCGGKLSEAARALGISRKKARILLERLHQAMAWLRDL